MRPAPLLKLRQLAEVLDPPRNATAAAAAAATRGGGGGWCALLPRRAHAREERGRVVHVHRRRLRVRVGRALVLRLRLLLGVLEREGYDLVALGAEATLVNRVELLPLVRHAHRNLLRHPALHERHGLREEHGRRGAGLRDGGVGHHVQRHGAVHQPRRPDEQRDLQARRVHGVVGADVHLVPRGVARALDGLVAAHVDEELVAGVLELALDAAGRSEARLDDERGPRPEAAALRRDGGAVAALLTRVVAALFGLLGLLRDELLVALRIRRREVVEHGPHLLRLRPHGGDVDAHLPRHGLDAAIHAAGLGLARLRAIHEPDGGVHLA
mmetsp:Transcript_26895/g.84342  ORF Transcript_26895/g.84342 Transcript_26895/m.84342 type:complete len:327 (-) Transcript_26895:729-1709(-)